ncbi:LysM peptidoglycan-binding domain-containing protein [Wukongibacter sp. M2B1]|uniref:LysM peptidoglycan-binding domain-containing protein n=1 Tax=Wukongibacter sp. M2B1 TaxID=3088895 RepID=UPI003D78D3E9
MSLALLKYKSYTWPVNPETYAMRFEKNTAIHHYPYTHINEIEDLGLKPREVSGNGEFIGEGAYEEFKKLATVFYDSGIGKLIHPIWQIQEAVFTRLELEQEPTPNYVKYSFTFTEHITENQIEEFDNGNYVENDTSEDVLVASINNETTTHIVKDGEFLFAIAKKYNTTWQEIAAKNNLKNPNIITPGQKLIV